MRFKIIDDAPWSAPITTDTFRYVSNLYIATINPFKNEHLSYKLFVMIKNIFAGAYTAKTNDKEFKYIENEFLGVLWVMQDIFITRANEKYQIWEVVKVHIQGDKRKIEARQYIAENDGVSRPTYMFIDGMHGIYVKWAIERLSSYYFWWPILKDLSKMLRSARISSKMDAKRLVKIVNHTNKDVLRLEQEAFLNEENPFLYIFKKYLERDETDSYREKSISPNEYKEIKSESKTGQIWINIHNYRNFWFSMGGIPMSNDDRPSGKTDGENILDVYRNLLSDNVTLRNLNVLADKMKKLWNVDIKFEKTVTLEDIYIENTDKDKEENENDKQHSNVERDK